MSQQLHQKEPDLLSTLCAVSLDAVDALVDVLRERRCVVNARLVCSGLRKIVDGSIRRLGFFVADPEDLEARWPSLVRWPRVQELYYSATDDTMSSSDIALAIEKFAVWAGGQPQASQHRVEVLRLDLSAACNATPSPYFSATLAASLAMWFPNIQELDISGCHMSALPVQQPDHLRTMITGGIGRLQQLQKLTLPGWSLLEALGEVQPRRGAAAAAAAVGDAGGGGGWLVRLQELEIKALDDDPITEAAAAGVASLCSLRVLRLSGQAAYNEATYGQDLLRLLEHVPTSLTCLSVSENWSIPGLTVGLELCFASGRLEQVTFPRNLVPISVEGIGAAAEDLLLPYLRARRVTLPRLVVHRMRLPVGGRGDVEQQQPLQLAPDEKLQAVRELLRLCEAVTVREVLVDARTKLPTVAQASSLLGVPQRLRYKAIYRMDNDDLTMRLRSAPAAQPSSEAQAEEEPGTAGAEQAVADSSTAAQRPQQQLSPYAGPPLLAPMPAAPRAVVSRAVQRLLTLPRVPPPAASQCTASHNVARLLVLRGPLVAGLAQSPELVNSWVKWLAEKATAAASSSQPRPGIQAVQQGRWCGRWQLVPAALGGPALLVSCGPQAQEALHAALRSVEPEAQLEAAWVVVERYPGYFGPVNLPAPLLWCIQQELDEACATADSCARGGNPGPGLESQSGTTGAGGGEQRPGAKGAPAAHLSPATPAAAAAAQLQERVHWLQQLGKLLEVELPECQGC